MELLKSHIGEYAIIINEAKQEVLLVQWSEEFNHTWHFLGGLLDDGELEKEGLIREAKEELNAELEIIRPIYTKHITEEYKWKPQDVTRYAIFYLCKLKNNNIFTDNKEIINYKWFKKTELNDINFFLPFYKEMLEEILPF